MAARRSEPGALPLYRKIAATLQQRIDSGEWTSGQKLPSEGVFASEFGVNRLTVRQALDDLVRAGSVVVHHGKGTFVVDHTTKVEIEVDERSQRHVGWRHATDTEPIEGERMVGYEAGGEAPPELLDLGIDGAKTLRVDTVIEVDGTPRVFSSYWFDRQRVPRLAARWGACRGVHEVLKKYGIEVAYDWRGFTAAPAGLAQAIQLQVAVGTALLVRDGVSVDQQGVPVYYVRRWVPGDRLKYVLRYRTG